MQLHQGERGWREIKVNPKLVYQNSDAPRLSDTAWISVIDRNIYRQSLLFIVRMYLQDFSFSLIVCECV